MFRKNLSAIGLTLTTLSSLCSFHVLANGSINQSTYCNADMVKNIMPRLSKNKLICLDSFKNKSKEDILFYDKVEKKLLYVKTKTRGSNPTKIREFYTVNRADFFPNHCGGSLAGARIIPKAELIVLIYPGNIMKTVNVRSEELVNQIDHSNPNGAFSCNNYDPDSDYRRDDVTVSVDRKKAYLNFSYEDFNDVEKKAVIIRPLEAYDYEKLADKKEYFSANVNKEYTLMNQAQDLEQKKYHEKLMREYQEQLDLVIKQTETGNLMFLETFPKTKTETVTFNF
ncbi:MAG: hypothetical protein ACOYL6_08680 [Bacteriovoracaceae bacterium]